MECSAIETAFKVLMRETSVYQYYVELKENSLTPKGYLDIAKVPIYTLLALDSFLGI